MLLPIRNVLQCQGFIYSPILPIHNDNRHTFENNVWGKYLSHLEKWHGSSLLVDQINR